MFLSYYRTKINEIGEVETEYLLGRDSWTKLDKSIKLNKQILVREYSGIGTGFDFNVEADRVAAIMDNQDLLTQSPHSLGFISLILRFGINSALKKITNHSIQFPNQKSSLVLKIKKFKIDDFIFSDGVSIPIKNFEGIYNFVESNYIEIKIKQGNDVSKETIFLENFMEPE